MDRKEIALLGGRPLESGNPAEAADISDKAILAIADKFFMSSFLAKEETAILWFARSCIEAAQAAESKAVSTPAPANNARWVRFLMSGALEKSRV